MTFYSAGAEALDYHHCRYGGSRLLFRGPEKPLDAPYCAVLGGSESYGKFVTDPWPALAEEALGLPVVNLAAMNAGIDVMLYEPSVLQAAGQAALTVVQLPGAHNLSNRFYSVHPRRNDRFLRASSQLKAIYPEVDFTEFTFTRHMLSELRRRAPERFGAVQEELRMAWLARMRLLLSQLDSQRTLLLWLDGHPGGACAGDGLGLDPLFVTPDLVAPLEKAGSRVLRVLISPQAWVRGREGMVCLPHEEAAAAELPGPLVHGEIAAQVAPLMADLLER